MAKRKLICQWRVMEAEPSGLLLWFDPETEFPRLYEVEPPRDSGVDSYCEEDDQDPGAEDPSRDKQMFRQERLPF